MIVRLSTIVILVFMAIGLSVLCGLGYWQVQRLHWKENLIATVDKRVKMQPVEITTFLNSGTPKEEWQYRPVSAQGVFDHQQEVYYFTANKAGQSGWNIHTPLVLQSGEKLIVNRGFVPFTLKMSETREQGQVKGLVNISGLLRVPEEEKPAAAFENSLQSREFYWRSLPQMIDLMREDDQDKFLPVFLDADDAPNSGGWPKGGATIIKFSNSHLQYAGTWFGLALTLLGVGGYFLYTRNKKGTKT